MRLRHSQLNAAPAPAQRRRGSVLGAVMILAVCLTIVVAGLLQWVNTEVRITRAHTTMAHARYAAEATAEFGLAQIRIRLQQQPVVPANSFSPAGLFTLRLPTGALLRDRQVSFASPLSVTSAPALDPSVPIDVVPVRLTAGSFSAERAQLLDPDNALYARDPNRRQNVFVREVRVLAEATAFDNARNAGTTAYCEEILQVRDNPLFSFVAFYNMELEVAPQPVMEVHGPVHANRDFYTYSINGIQYHGVVTTAGRVIHGLPPGSGMSISSGDVSFTGKDGNQASMRSGSQWLDSTASNWVSASLNRWGANVMSGAHGVTPTMPAGIPPYVPDDPSTSADELDNSAHVLIEASVPTTDTARYPGDDIEVQKYSAKASLVVRVRYGTAVVGGKTVSTVNADVYKYTADPAGTYIRPTSNGAGHYRRELLATPSGLIVARSFYDARQAQTIESADIDVGLLKNLIERDSEAARWTNGATTFQPGSEWNGVVYVEHTNPRISSSKLGAIRLVNGRNVPNRPTAANDSAAGFTLATNVPLYVSGNYNADGNIPSDGSQIVMPEAGEPPASIAADAVTVLSNNWNDANSTKNLNSRRATTTEVAAAVLTGTVPTNKDGNRTWSGGLNNLVRYLENWDRVTVGFRSSMVVMFESEFATAPWSTYNVYNPPQRLFGLNDHYARGITPPGTPKTRTFRRIGLRWLSATEYTEALASL